ncbi:hypothetical protein CSA56_11495 [candidate division KSB3 bacterium]|uniref:Uncharacterized protein n=1 Tax=candidate division KSB3 bacterium TaxID=2044937 RepID=A0A2G6KF10_9BACT|nr:MAG: hypothetical protein CSA56_11495 [candidate division KSB3 bacterium]
MIVKIDRKKWENFWYYYKIHFWVGVFIVLFIIMTIRDCSQRIEPDVSWGYMGSDLTAERIRSLEQELLPLVQDANHDGKTHLRLYALSDPQQIVVMMASGDTQLFTFDAEVFTNFATGGAFQVLDTLIEAYQVDVSAHPEVLLQAQETPEKHVYGLPLEGNVLLEQTGFRLEGKYLGVRVAKHPGKSLDSIAYENAYAILQRLLQEY